VQRILIDYPRVDNDAGKENKSIAITDKNASEVLKQLNKLNK
jgi:hypothetical protein